MSTSRMKQTLSTKCCDYYVSVVYEKNNTSQMGDVGYKIDVHTTPERQRNSKEIFTSAQERTSSHHVTFESGVF